MKQEAETTVVGTFEDAATANRAVTELLRTGFSESDVGVVSKDQTRSVDSAAGVDPGDDRVTSDAAAGAAAGAGAGLLWGLGVAAGFLPAVGPVIAGGLLASLIASTAGGAAAGGIIGSLVGLGIDETDAAKYEADVKSGRTVVTVRTGHDRARQASEILKRFGASNLFAAGQSTDAGSAGTRRETSGSGAVPPAEQHRVSQTAGREAPEQDARPISPRTAQTSRQPQSSDSDADTKERDPSPAGRETPGEARQTMTLRAEELHPTKETVHAGDVEVRKEVVTETKTVDVPVSREELVIERRPASARQGGSPASPDLGPDAVRVPLKEERAKAEKRVVATEEVEIGKRPVESTERLSESVRREEIRVDDNSSRKRDHRRPTGQQPQR